MLFGVDCVLVCSVPMRQLVLSTHAGSESIQTLLGASGCGLFACLSVCLLVQISIPQLVLVFVPTGSVSIQTLLECFLVWTACLFVQFSMLQLVLGANLQGLYSLRLCLVLFSVDYLFSGFRHYNQFWALVQSLHPFRLCLVFLGVDCLLICLLSFRYYNWFWALVQSLYPFRLCLECRLFAYLFAQFPLLQLVLGAGGGTPRGRVARGAPLPASRGPPLARPI